MNKINKGDVFRTKDDKRAYYVVDINEEGYEVNYWAINGKKEIKTKILPIKTKFFNKLRKLKTVKQTTQAQNLACNHQILLDRKEDLEMRVKKLNVKIQEVDAMIDKLVTPITV